MIDKICEYCSKPFQVVNARKDKARFCSYSCRSKQLMGSGETARFWKGGKPKYKCLVCGKEGERRVSTGSTYNFCSTKCHDVYRQNRVDCVCSNCGKTFQIKASKANRGNHSFCSHVCRIGFFVRENSPHWKGGERGRKFYPKEWNKAFKVMIRERDNYTCAICKEYGDSVHHINYVKNDTVPENCITLCRGCHAKTNSNREYWLEYFLSR